MLSLSESNDKKADSIAGAPSLERRGPNVAGPGMATLRVAAGAVEVSEQDAPTSYGASTVKYTAQETVVETTDGANDHDDGDDDGDDDDDQSDISYLEDIIEGTISYKLQGGAGTDPDICTPEEARYYRERVRQIEVGDFVAETIEANVITAKKLLTAFRVRIDLGPDEPDTSYYKPLGVAIAQELSRRQRLSKFSTIDDAAALLQKSSNVMVITGAGISTSLGIPDFRSKTSGFYAQLRARGFHEPEQVFDLAEFDEDPSIFYSLAGELLPDLKRFSPTHQFIRLLQDKGKLRRNYTQNIDNIEENAGISTDKLIQCHGSWATATCRKCRHQVPGREIFPFITAQQIAHCEKCKASLGVTPQLKRKLGSTLSYKQSKRRWGSDGEDDSEDDGQYDIPEPGVMKPDIIFFGEQLPKQFFDVIKYQDYDVVDLVIVIGTSMKVKPVSEIPNFLPKNVPHIYISRDPCYHINFDITLVGDSDVVVAELCRRAGWELEHEMIPADQKVITAPYEDWEPECTWHVVPQTKTNT